MSHNFKNKKILITGSTSGLGLVCAKNFIDKKATVYVCGRKKRNLALLKKDKSNNIYSFCGDLLIRKNFLKFSNNNETDLCTNCWSRNIQLINRLKSIKNSIKPQEK